MNGEGIIFDITTFLECWHVHFSNYGTRHVHETRSVAIIVLNYFADDRDMTELYLLSLLIAT